MIKTKDLILDKAKYSDWKAIYENVWSHEESAKYMFWNVTLSEEDAKSRILRTIDFQKTHDTYFVYEKTNMQAIGFAGVERISDGVYRECGICLGPNYVGKGYGKQILRALIDYCKTNFKATEFLYSSDEENEASKALARSFGFVLTGRDDIIDEKTGEKFAILKYSLKI